MTEAGKPAPIFKRRHWQGTLSWAMSATPGLEGLSGHFPPFTLLYLTIPAINKIRLADVSIFTPIYPGFALRVPPKSPTVVRAVAMLRLRTYNPSVNRGIVRDGTLMLSMEWRGAERSDWSLSGAQFGEELSLS